VCACMCARHTRIICTHCTHTYACMVQTYTQTPKQSRAFCKHAYKYKYAHTATRKRGRPRPESLYEEAAEHEAGSDGEGTVPPPVVAPEARWPRWGVKRSRDENTSLATMFGSHEGDKNKGDDAWKSATDSAKLGRGTGFFSMFGRRSSDNDRNEDAWKQDKPDLIAEDERHDDSTEGPNDTSRDDDLASQRAGAILNSIGQPDSSISIPPGSTNSTDLRSWDHTQPHSTNSDLGMNVSFTSMPPSGQCFVDMHQDQGGNSQDMGRHDVSQQGTQTYATQTERILTVVSYVYACIAGLHVWSRRDSDSDTRTEGTFKNV
jgi:hypothetical protein